LFEGYILTVSSKFMLGILTTNLTYTFKIGYDLGD